MMKTSCTRYVAPFVSAFALLTAGASNWPGWRGPDGTGVSADKGFPLTWSKTENVRWHVALPGPGNSSPIVWGNRIFTTQAIKGDNRRTIMCFDRADGKLLWQSGPAYAEQEPTQENNPYCAATPVTDGERIIASFGSAGVYCYDLDGKELWHRDLGKMTHMFGNASSPILHGDLCFLSFGPDEKARLIAMDKRDGKTVWEVQPPKVDPSEQQPMRGGPGGPGGPGGGGRGGFGPGTTLAPQMLAQADKNADQKVSKEEFSALADAWFDRLDPDKAGKLNQEQFTARITEVLPAPQGSAPAAGRPPAEGLPPGGGRGDFNPGRFVGPGLFSAADADKDGSLTRVELKSTFEKWFVEWDSEKAGALTEEQLRQGLTAALPRPNFGGPGGPGGRGGPGGSWSTPIILTADGREELVMSFPNRLAAYEPASGKPLWLSKGIGDGVYVTPLVGEGVVVAMSGGPAGGIAIGVKPGGSGDVSDSQRLWRQERFKSAIGSGVVHDSHFYVIGSDGIAGWFELKTGNKVWEERLKGPGAKGSSWSSMILVDGKIYLPNQSGDVFVLRASPKFEILATNSVEESTNASLAPSEGELFLRTDKSLWCFGAAKQ